MAFPILPGKKEVWQAFIDKKLNGPGRAEAVQLREDAGIHERSFLQETPGGDMVIITAEGRDPMQGMGKMMSQLDDEWKAMVKEVHGMDMDAGGPPPAPPKLVFDSWE